MKLSTFRRLQDFQDHFKGYHIFPTPCLNKYIFNANYILFQDLERRTVGCNPKKGEVEEERV